MKTKGTISSWKEEKGFGFISPDSGGSQIFVHINEFKKYGHQPCIGQKVLYIPSKDKKGRTYAKIVKVDGYKVKKKGNDQLFLASIIAFIFLAIAGISVSLGKLPKLVFISYLIISLMTVIAYAFDKLRAKKGWWRTQESTLHLFSLIGGWPGAMVAQQFFRHKTKKKQFRFIFWLTVLINVGIFIWFHTTDGSSELQSWMPVLQERINNLKQLIL